MVVLIALVVCAIAATQGLAQAAAMTDEERQVREWVERDIAAAKAFVAAPENTHIKMVVTRGQAGTPEQVREYETTMAAMRRAVEGKPDHPLREEMRTKWRDAPGSSELASNEIWLGTLGGLAAGRSSVTYHNDILNEPERLIDLGDNGRVLWERIGMQGALILRQRDRSGFKEISAGTGLGCEVLFGWFGIYPAAQTPTDLSFLKNEGSWVLLGTLGDSKWKAVVRWDIQTSTGFVESREMVSSVAGFRVRRTRAMNSAEVTPSIVRVEFLTSDGEVDSFTQADSIEVRSCSNEELYLACELPKVGASDDDPVRGKLATMRVVDYRVAGNGDSVPWTNEIRQSALALTETTSSRTRAELDESQLSLWTARWIWLGCIVVAGAAGFTVWYARRRARSIS